MTLAGTADDMEHAILLADAEIPEATAPAALEMLLAALLAAAELYLAALDRERRAAEELGSRGSME